jgi:serine/threonine protein kinase
MIRRIELQFSRLRKCSVKQLGSNDTTWNPLYNNCSMSNKKATVLSISTGASSPLREQSAQQPPSSPQAKKKTKTKKPSNMCLAVQSFHVDKSISTGDNDSHWNSTLYHEFELLRSIIHDGVCEQVDLVQSTTGSDLNFLVSIQYKTTLRDEIDFCRKQNKRVNDDRVYRVFAQLWNAVHVLHAHGVHIGYLTPDCLCLDNFANVKIGHYGLYHLYKFIKPRVTVLGTPPYLAPELYAALKLELEQNETKPIESIPREITQKEEDVWCRINSECDVWTVAVILLEYILSTKMPVSFTASMQDGDRVYRDLMDFVKYCGERRSQNNDEPQRDVSKEYVQAYERLSRIDSSIGDIILSCLTLSPVHRPSIEWIMQHEFFSSISREKPTHIMFNYVPIPLLKCNDLDNQPISENDLAIDDSPKRYDGTVRIPGLLHTRSRSNSFENSPSTNEILSKKPEGAMISSYRLWRDHYEYTGKPISRYFESKRETVYLPRTFRVNTIVTQNKKLYEGNGAIWINQQLIRNHRTLTIPNNLLQDWMEANGHTLVTSSPTPNSPPAVITTTFVAVPPFMTPNSPITEGAEELKSASKYDQDQQVEDILSEEDSAEEGVRMLSNSKYSSLVHVTGDLYRKRTHSSKHNTPYPWTSFDNLLTKNDKNADYQKGRVALFRRLLLEYPHTRYEIIREAKADIPGVLRGEIWAAILGVEHDLDALDIYNGLLHKINSMRRNGRWLSSECEASDRQIAVDVPRCHQYNKLLASPTGHAKLTRVLRSWVVYHDTTPPSPATIQHQEVTVNDDHHPKRAEGPLVYWQGLDSLTAPFVVLNFHFEARAFVCLRALVDKYVKGFFARDNSHAMEERLVTFQKLLIYHDPELGLHLRNIGFSPELYAIPWFLTLFAHVLPIEKIFKLWDALLLSSSSHHLPIFLAIGMMRQLRSNLLHSDFNSAMTLFQNMQGIDIRRAIKDADHIVERTPKSILSSPVSFSLQHYNDKCLCPRLSPREFDTLGKIAFVIDVRKLSDFANNHVTMAHHFKSFLHEETEDEDAIDESVLSEVKCKQGLPIVLIGKNDCKEANRVMEKIEKLLVLEQIPYVSVVDGGMEAIKQS